MGSYHTIEAYGVFKIILNTDGPETVKFTSEQPHLLNSVKAIVERGILKLTMNGTSSNFFSSGSSVIIMNNDVNYSSKNTFGAVIAHISGAHHLTSLILSGQCSVESRNPLVGDRFQLTSSGSSSFDGSFKINQLEVNISGSSSVSFGGSTDTIILSVSGSSSCNVMGLTTKTAQITSSGCSNALLKGSGETISLNVSGSSSCEAVDFEAKTMRVSVSGSSHARVYCTQTLEVNVQGLSKVKYKGNAKILKGTATKID